MSQESVEVVRAIYGEWGRGRSAVHLIHPDVERGKPQLALEPAGRDLALVGDVSDFTATPEQYIDARDDEVLVFATTCRIDESGVRSLRRRGYVWTVCDGRALRLRCFSDPADALEAVGLSEQAAHLLPRERPSEG